MSNKRILFISCWNPTSTNPNNGVFIRRHAEAIRKNGADVDVLAVNIRHGEKLIQVDFQEGEELTLTIESFAWKFIYTGYPIIRFILRNYFIKHFTPGCYDLIVSNVTHPTAVIGNELSKVLQVPHYIIEHFSKTEYHLTHPLLGREIKRLYNTAAGVFPVSNFLLNIIKKHAPKAQCQVIPNVIDTEVFKFKDKTLSKTIKFLAVANWHQTKRQVKRPDLIIESLGLLQSKYPDLDIIIEFIGDGNMHNDMKLQCKKHGLNAQFSGSQKAAYISKSLQDATFFVHASMIETFSVVIVEALACGTPVVASNVGAIPDLIHAQNGVLCDNTVIKWQRALEQAIETKYDHPTIAKQVQDKYSYTSVGHKLLSLLSS